MWFCNCVVYAEWSSFNSRKRISLRVYNILTLFSYSSTWCSNASRSLTHAFVNSITTECSASVISINILLKCKLYWWILSKVEPFSTASASAHKQSFVTSFWFCVLLFTLIFLLTLAVSLLTFCSCYKHAYHC